MKKTMSFIILFALCTCLYKPVIHVSSSKLLNQRVIVLDPGHGGLDNGASVAGVDEDTLNLKISFALKEELESRGATVYMTRTDDQDMTKRNYNYSKQDDMYLRALQVDAYQPDLFLSIHLNSSTSSAWGSQVFYYKKSEDGKRLANCIHDQMKTLTGTRKNVSSSSFYILRATQSLGVLIECGFLSNPEELRSLQDNNYQKKAVQCILDGIESYLADI